MANQTYYGSFAGDKRGRKLLFFRLHVPDNLFAEAGKPEEMGLQPSTVSQSFDMSFQGRADAGKKKNIACFMTLSLEPTEHTVYARQLLVKHNKTRKKVQVLEGEKFLQASPGDLGHAIAAMLLS